MSSDLQLGDCSRREGHTRCFRALAKHLARFVTTNTSTPLTTLFLILVRAITQPVSASNLLQMKYNLQVSLGRIDERGQLPLIFALDILQSQHCCSLLVHDGAKP